MADDARLLLLANEAGEVPLISTLVQDAVVHAADIAWEPRARRLVLLVNRFRWEAGDHTRVRTALRLESVTRLQRRGWPHGDAILDLLAITVDGDVLTLDFRRRPDAPRRGRGGRPDPRRHRRAVAGQPRARAFR